MTGRTLATTLFAALVAGVAGGFVAIQLSSDSDAAPIMTAVKDEEQHDYSDELDSLRNSIKLLEGRILLSESQPEAPDIDVPNATVKKLTERIEQLERTPVSTTKESETTFKVDSETVSKAIRKELDEQKAQDSAARKKKKAAGVKKWLDGENKRLMSTMTKKLELAQWQQESIGRVLDTYNARYQEMVARVIEAKENGDDFDWDGEFSTIGTEFTPLIEAELTATQLETFRETIGEGGDIGDFLGDGWGK